MDVEQALRAANSALFAQKGRRLTETEAAILLGPWQSQAYEQIAETSGYAISYLKRDVGPQLWKRLEQALCIFSRLRQGQLSDFGFMNPKS